MHWQQLAQQTFVLPGRVNSLVLEQFPGFVGASLLHLVFAFFVVFCDTFSDFSFTGSTLHNHCLPFSKLQAIAVGSDLYNGIPFPTIHWCRKTVLHFIPHSVWPISVDSKGLRISPKDIASHNFLRFLQANLAQFNSAKHTSLYLTFVDIHNVQVSLQGMGA